jgi:hypothetical protein
MSSPDARDRLLRFLDEHAFDPVLRCSLAHADRREALEDAQACVERLKRQYHARWSAEAIRAQFLHDVHDDVVEKANRELERLGLPTLPRLTRDFLRLSDDLGVGDDAAVWAAGFGGHL